MNSAELNAQLAQHIKDLAAATDAAKCSETLAAYIETQARFHCYSLRNVLSIMYHKPDATQVAGYNAWLGLRRYVKRGEKGIPILAPCTYKAKDTGETERVFFKVVYVFDVSQTDGEPLPDAHVTINGDDDQNLIPVLTAAIQKAGITVGYQDLGAIRGQAEKGRITINPTFSRRQQLKTLCHEWAHHILHVSRPDRPDDETVELEAEAAAHVAMRAFGYTIDESANYIALWNGTGDDVLQRLGQISTAARTIIAAVKRPTPDPA